MKKAATKKKLVLAKETVRNLELVAGGLTTLGPGEGSGAGWTELSCGDPAGFCGRQKPTV